MSLLLPSEVLRQWLHKALASWEPGTAFPTEVQLAHDFKVSRSTVQRVIASLSQAPSTKGRILRVPGRGTFVALQAPTVREGSGQPSQAFDPSLPPPESPQSAVERLVAELVSRIASGEFKKGTELPAVKCAVRAFRVSPATIAKAYRKLAQEGFAFRQGRKYRIGRQEPVSITLRNRPIYLVQWGPCDPEPPFGENMLGRALLKVEEELQESGRLLLPVAREAFPELCRNLAKRLDSPAGIVLFHLNQKQEAESVVKYLAEALRVGQGTSATRTPPVLLAGTSSATASLAKLPPRFSLFNSGNIDTIQMRTCAKKLIEQGMKKAIFFFDPEDGYPEFSRCVKILPELWRLHPGFPVTLRLASSPDQARHRQEELQAFKIHLERFKPILSKYSDQDPARIATAWQQFMDDAGTELTLTSVRQAAVISPFTQAWLFTRLRTAKACLADRFTQKHQATGSASHSRSSQVSSNPWIIAFERDLSGLKQGISCCVPDWDAIGYAMAHSLLEDVPVERSRKGFLRAKAIFLDRLQPFGMRGNAISSPAPGP